MLSDAVTGTGPALDRPKGIALDLPGGRALVIDMALRAVLTVDLATGNRQVLSTCAVIMIDGKSGDRVIVSKQPQGPSGSACERRDA